MSTRTHSVLVMLSVAVILTLVTFGAVIGGSWELTERFDMDPEVPPAQVEATPDLGRFEEAAPQESGDPPDLSWLGIVGVLLAVAIIAVIVRWLWSWWQQRAPAPSAVRGAGSMSADAAEPELPVLRQGVAAAQRLLEEAPEPTDAIIAAWLALEEAAADSGVQRRRAQTPTEFTIAVLERTNADPQATRGILGLYHRARFSGHQIGDAEVAEAAGHLRQLAAGWDTLDRVAHQLPTDLPTDEEGQ